MIYFQDKRTQLDSILDQMAADIQLNQTRYEKMVTSYEAVRKCIEGDEDFFQPYNYEVYPHGSVRILTSIKPIQKEEFDLDIVLHFTNENITHSPLKIYNELKRVLQNSPVYKDMVDLKSRCIRLNYSGDFHMDIMPGVQLHRHDENKIKIPDRTLGKWVSSNPRGYADWFLAKANLVQMSLLEKAMRAEEIQIDDFRKKKPLQRAVQLIKRYRDIYFESDPTYKPRSVILTTIAGQFYEGNESIYDSINNIVNNIKSNINGIERIKVFNPVNPEEEFTDKWEKEPKYEQAFKNFIIHLDKEWSKLREEHGLITEGNIMKGLFGEDLYKRAKEKESIILESIRSKQNLFTERSTGLLTSTSSSTTSKIKENTFYGS